MILQDAVYPRIYHKGLDGLVYAVRRPGEHPLCLSDLYSFFSGTWPFWSGDYEREEDLARRATPHDTLRPETRAVYAGLIQTQLERCQDWRYPYAGDR